MGSVEVLEQRLGVSLETIREFCKRWNVVEFALFGSIVRDDFRPDSDVDVMVRFAEGQRPRGLAFITAKLELEDLLGRSVDFVEFGLISKPSMKASVERDLTRIYAA